MKTKQKILNEIEKLTEDTLAVVLKFILSLEKGTLKTQAGEDVPWPDCALETGSFDFWLDPGETDYTLDDLKQTK